MMPGIDGLEFCRRVRASPELQRVAVVMVTAKAYEFDKRRARQMGAAGFLAKPVGDDFVARVETVLDGRIRLQYWGVRGTLPVRGAARCATAATRAASR